MIRQRDDRNKRLRVALFIYASIACSNLPSFSNFWAGLGKSVLTEQEFRRYLADVDSLDSGIQAKLKQVRLKAKRLIIHLMVWEGLEPSLYSNPAAQPLLSPDFLSDSLHDPHSEVVDEAMNYYDKYHMGGLISATVSGSFAEIRIRKFYLVAQLDWMQAFSKLSSSGTCFKLSNRKLFRLVTDIAQRRYVVELCESVRLSVIESGGSAADIIQVLRRASTEAFEEVRTVKSSEKRRQKKLLLWMREGLRWRELRELAGEEIYLLSSPDPAVTEGTEVRSLDIPFIARKGSEADFNHLKRLLLSSQSWLKETCTQLRGLVHWVDEAIRVFQTDRDAALDLASRIQERVFSVFGTREFMDEVLDRQLLNILVVFASNLSKSNPIAFERFSRWLTEAEDTLEPLIDIMKEEREKQETEEEPEEEELEELERSTVALAKVFLETRD
jgi:hypothetical protein